MKLSQLKSVRQYMAQTESESRLKCFLILSTDPLQREEIRQLILDALPRSILDGEDLTPRRLMDELDTDSLFHPKGPVVCQAAEKLSTGCRQALEHYMRRPVLESVLCLEASSEGPLVSIVEKHGVVIDLVNLPPWEREEMVRSWIMERVVQEGKEINSDAVQELIHKTGGDSQVVRQEIEKILCYSGGRKRIEPADVRAVVCEHGQAVSWELGQFLLERNVKEALHRLDRLLNQSESAHALLAQVRSQFNTAFGLASLAAGGMKESEMTRRFPHLKGKRLSRELKRACDYGVGRFPRALATLAVTDETSKRSSVDMTLLLSSMVVKLCH